MDSNLEPQNDALLVAILMTSNTHLKKLEHICLFISVKLLMCNVHKAHNKVPACGKPISFSHIKPPMH